MGEWVYAALAAVLVTVGILLAVVGGDRSVVAALLLLGCLCAIAFAVGPGRD